MTRSASLKRYVVTPDVAVYGGLPPELFALEHPEVAFACAQFLARASFHGVELHVPSIFYSEVTSLLGSSVLQGMITLEAGQESLEAILGTTWEFHFAVVGEVLEIQHHINNAGPDAEYLAVATALGCPIITTDTQLIELTQSTPLTVEIMHVLNHVWAKPGALEDDPPD